MAYHDDQTWIAFSFHEQKIVLVDIAGNIIIAAVDSSRISTPFPVVLMLKLEDTLLLVSVTVTENKCVLLMHC